MRGNDDDRCRPAFRRLPVDWKRPKTGQHLDCEPQRQNREGREEERKDQDHEDDRINSRWLGRM